MNGPLALTAPVGLHVVVDGGALGAVVLEHPAVPPPTVAAALAVLSADPERARAALPTWLPARLASDVAPLPDDALVQLLAQLLRAFSPSASGREAGEGAAFDPEATVCDVALALGQRPGDVLTMPWPEFLAAAAAAGRARTARLLDEATAARVAGADAEGWRSFTAAIEDGGHRAPDGERVQKTPEQMERERAEAAEWAEAMRVSEAAKAQERAGDA